MLYISELHGNWNRRHGERDQLHRLARLAGRVITPPKVANTGPGANRGSGGGAQGCGFEERVGVHARTGGVLFYFPMAILFKKSVCVRVPHKMAV